MWVQKQVVLRARARGFHLITDEVLAQVPECKSLSMGLMHIFICHTSASLTINENADPSVRGDFKRFADRLIPEGEPYYEHVDEGLDDMPAHLKSSIIGSSSVSVPISNGALAAGIWQGVYLCEHRDYGGSRKLVVTIQGQA